MILKLKLKKSIFSKAVFFLLTILAVGFLGYRLRPKFLGGLVNGEPIFRFQLTGRLYSSYGRQVLEDLIVEKLISQEAKKEKISVSAEQLNQAIEKIKAQLGEQTDLDSVLAIQGIRRSDFENQLKIQILVQKLLEREVSISKEEIAEFIKENKKIMEATAEADLEAEAKESLLNQKISERLNPWISELVSRAKVLRFVK